MTPAQIKHMVDRFLRWKLPENFAPDGGITFEPIGNKGTAFEHRREPIGTNLFTASQAEAMIEHMVSGMPEKDWRDDPASDEAWWAGNQFVFSQLCTALGVNADRVVWDGSDGPIEEETQALVWRILDARNVTAEIGWVIERGDSEPRAPSYWSGSSDRVIDGNWSTDHLDAVRFVRKIDAVRAAAKMLTDNRVCEHMWVGPKPADQQGEVR